MGARKKNVKSVLQHIPLGVHEGGKCGGYADIMGAYSDELNGYLGKGFAALQCVIWEFNNNKEITEENGMDKFVAVIAGMLFLMQNNVVHANLAYAAVWDIYDFETGDYDDLFSPEDLALIKKDIAQIKTYANGKLGLSVDEYGDLVFADGKLNGFSVDVTRKRTRSKNRIVHTQDVLQHIPFDDEEDEDDEHLEYKECKELFPEFYFYAYFRDEDYTIIPRALWTYNELEYGMDENGMFKFIALIAGMLCMIEEDEVFTDVVYGLNWDIHDFETGNYDDLFTPEDLVMIKKDIAVIKEYIEKHPELLLDENEAMIFSKGERIEKRYNGERTWSHRKKIR